MTKDELTLMREIKQMMLEQKDQMEAIETAIQLITSNIIALRTEIMVIKAIVARSWHED